MIKSLMNNSHLLQCSSMVGPKPLLACLSLLLCSPVIQGQTGDSGSKNVGKPGKIVADVRSSASLAAAHPMGDIGQADQVKRRDLRADYRIGPGDVLEINVWKEQQLSVAAAMVRPDGKLSLPLVKEIDVLGLTPDELEHVLTDKFSRFIEVPEVTVIVKEVHSEKIYVIGGVKKPGSVDLYSQLTVLQVLAEAGGLTEYAKKKGIFILRKEGGKQSRLPFNYNAQLKGKTGKLEIVLQPGDTVVVPQ